MNYKEIKSSIKDHTASLYVFYGEEVFLRDYVTSMLIKKVVEPDFADFNYLVLTNETANIETVADFFEAYPFAAERKLIHIKDANIFSGKADGKDDWLRLLSSIPDYVTVLITEDTIDKRLTTYKALSKVGEFAEFAYLERFDIKAHVSKKLTQSKKEMKAQDVDFFLDLCGPDLTGIRLSLDKLIAYSGENTLITRADIENNITPPLLNRIYDISEAILSKNSDYALKLLGDLKKSGESGLRVLAVISGYFQDRQPGIQFRIQICRYKHF